MARVIVVGSGLAGRWTAVRAAQTGHEVTLVTKAGFDDANTTYAQGGIAAAVFADDSPALHAADTLAASGGLGDPAAIDVLCGDGPDRLRDLIRFGTAFDRDDDGLARGLEAAHSRARIVHAGGDATGRAIQAALGRAVRRAGVRVEEHVTLVDVLTEGGRAAGIRVVDGSGALRELDADAVVLATGGSGCLYRHTTNPDVATGDGVAAAWRAGARVADLEFVQFHPTALAAPGTPLVSEAVRGEGAVIRDATGRRFLFDVDVRGELAPRDVVARAVWRRMNEQGGQPVLLDATALGADFLARRFPGLHRDIRSAGFDWAREPVPITPAAHYAMGGVVTDLDGRTSVPGLFAVGEVARTGVHGANRLASNSLLEAAVFAERAARALPDADPDADALFRSFPAVSAGTRRVFLRRAPFRRAVPENGMSSELAGAGARAGAGAGAGARAGAGEHDRGRAVVARNELQAVMWEHVGLERDERGLLAASARLQSWRAPEVTDRRTAEDRNLLDLARLTVDAALARRDSVGAHVRTDSAHPTAAHPAREAA